MECAGIFEQKLLDQLVFNQNPNKVFIYIVNLAECKLNINPFLQCLAAEEQVQASKYYTDHLRRQYIISHGILRYILGYYTKQHPKDIIFSYGAYGKPFLKESNITFNMSHSHDLVGYAIALDSRVGIDIELHDKNLEVQELAHLVFTPTEYRFFTCLNGDAKVSFFYDIWTKKESLIKANGQGLSYPINTIETMGANTIALASKQNRYPKSWYCFPLRVKGDYSAALAIEHKINQIAYVEMHNHYIFNKIKIL
ncbi:4'-phosphopantetheinyl transferase family protein [Cardinium endosymbiont of Oedothorax gibbosus]|uniref:4'-phosphopantetheinyl transferase family protein n=1 Tax=Cardinium endosymbiont of Oedothorax gibbosus TaxID=931101 RepID=UPI0020243E22|nr:4'-phosphopantetheinyl transferase superfamily protein [Cardinium endosymbiont of Oedothorax gibbosus]